MYLSLTMLYCLKAAVELNPEQGHSKYMYLGQIAEGEEAVGYLMQGINIMLLEERGNVLTNLLQPLPFLNQDALSAVTTLQSLCKLTASVWTEGISTVHLELKDCL